VSGSLLAVCVVHATLPDAEGLVGATAIDKRPASGQVMLSALGLAGDRQADLERHGGLYQAAYAYAVEDHEWWAAHLGADIVPGQFGENLVTRGIDVTDAVIGQIWQVGAAVVQVTSPRIPCATFQRWMAQPHWVRRFTEAGRPGAYLRVLTEGAVAGGDAVSVLSTPEHGVTIGQVFAGRSDGEVSRDALTRLLAEGVDLDPTLVGWVERALAVGG